MDRDVNRRLIADDESSSKYALEFKQEAVRQAKAGYAGLVVAATLGMPKASLTNWVIADAKRCRRNGVSRIGGPVRKRAVRMFAVKPGV